jgi:hypothetical protein
MTKYLITAEKVLEIFKLCEKDGEGWVKSTAFIRKICEELKCSRMTGYKVVLRHLELFEKRHGFLRLRSTTQNIELPKEQHLEWLDKQNKFLDKIVEYLKTQPPSVQKDYLLVKIGSAREELRDGVSYGVEEIKIRLEQDFGYKVEEAEEGEKPSEAEAEKAEENESLA